ncbi:NADH-quinone oxidoreductase subunit NuoE [Fibrobacterota bacterium]
MAEKDTVSTVAEASPPEAELSPEEIKEEQASVEKIINRYDIDTESLLPILQEVQEELHYLPEHCMRSTASHLEIPLSRVFSVATFYNAFSLIPKGKYNIQVCTGTACHIKGAGRLMDELYNQLSIKDGETTEDRHFSVETVRCLGCCSLAPVLMINGKTFGNLQPEKIKKILKQYKS